MVLDPRSFSKEIIAESPKFFMTEGVFTKITTKKLIREVVKLVGSKFVSKISRLPLVEKIASGPVNGKFDIFELFPFAVSGYFFHVGQQNKLLPLPLIIVR
jgi:hypothetical protein